MSLKRRFAQQDEVGRFGVYEVTGPSCGLIVGQRHDIEILDCRVTLRPPSAFLFAFECNTAAVAVDIDFEDRRVMDEAIDGSQRHGWVREDLAPSPERLIGGDQDGATFVARADQLEQN